MQERPPFALSVHASTLTILAPAVVAIVAACRREHSRSVCCTEAKRRQILNPAADTPRSSELHAVRRRASDERVDAIYEKFPLALKYCDGMKDTELPRIPGNFQNAPLDECRRAVVHNLEPSARCDHHLTGTTANGTWHPTTSSTRSRTRSTPPATRMHSPTRGELAAAGRWLTGWSAG